MQASLLQKYNKQNVFKQKNCFCKILFCVLIIPFSCLHSQESIQFITENAKLSSSKYPQKKSLANHSLSLPIIDDFSYASSLNVYPDPSLWIDKKVYINNSFGYNPVSIGVASFDILDENGQIYAQAANRSTFGADTLTSQPIDLSGYTLSDSIYLSFYYQAGGYGEIPGDKDSLLVEFYSSKTNVWQKIWGTAGNSKITSPPPFQMVLIKLNQAKWIDSTFQFRFINKGSLNNTTVPQGMRTNSSIWNVDYVYLNKDRNWKDSSLNDIAITQPITTFLKTYRAIPWKHYQNFFYKAINDIFYLHVFNHSESSTSVEDKIVVIDLYENISEEPISTAIDISGRSFSSFQENCPILKSEATDSALFLIKANIVTNRYDRKQNDTVVSYQVFNNYYAYDDGTAEYGYGLRGSNIIGATVAYKFETFQADTLTAVDIYFNRSFNDENITYFNLLIWNDQNNRPGDSIAGKAECKPIFQSSLGQFVRFYLPQPIITPTTFYIGWQQIDETFLNIGYDRNSPNNNKIFYNLTGNPSNWIVSSLNKKGALMIRPIFRKYSPSLVENQPLSFIQLYPNPASDYITLMLPYKLNNFQQAIVQLYNMKGKMIIHKSLLNNNEIIDIRSLSSGIYLLKIRTTLGEVYVAKLIKK